MPIVNVGQFYRGHQPFVILDQAVRDVAIHEGPTSLQRLQGDLGAILVNIANPLVMNPIRPARSEDRRSGKLNQQVSDRRWIENACVIDDGEIR